MERASLDQSLPPSQEPSPGPSSRRLSHLLEQSGEGKGGGGGDDDPTAGGDDALQQQQQQQEAEHQQEKREGEQQERQESGDGGSEPPGVEAEPEEGDTDGVDGGKGAGPGPGPAPGQDGDAATATPMDSEPAAEPSDGGRFPTGTGVGSEPSADVGDASAGGGAGGAAAEAAAMMSSQSSSLSRATGSRGLMGVRGISKSFNVPLGGRESPTRQIRSRGSLPPVREVPRATSAHSSRPASSAIAASSVPPSPDPYSSEGPRPPISGMTSGMSFNLWSAQGAVGSGLAGCSSGPPLFDDVEIRGSAMKLRTTPSSASREVRGAVVAVASPEPPPPQAVASPVPSAPPSMGITAVATAGMAVQDSSQHPPPSSSSVPSMALGVQPILSIQSSRNRPLVMPFLERHGAAAAAAMSASAAAASAAAGGLGAPAGRRQGAYGTIRHGSAFQQQPLAGTSSHVSYGSYGKDSAMSGVRRPSGMRDQVRTGTSASEPQLTARSHTETAEGVPLDDFAPPLYAASSREWDKPRAGGGGGAAAAGSHAAGGGAAAVKAAAAAVAASGGKAGGAAGMAADVQLQQQLMLGESIQIRSIQKIGVAQGLDPQSVSASGLGLVGVPGRRGRRIPAQTSNTSPTAAAMNAYFAGLEASIADGTAADKVLLPSGLARRLKAARMMASGPPPFQRRREPPPPPSPSGIKLDGFMLLEAADEEMPEAVQSASLESRHISAVESADLSYFVALRNLDVSDNKLPDLVCLATLQALVRLRAASCRLSSLGPWPGSVVGSTTDGEAAAAAASGGGGDAASGKAGGAAAGVLRRQRTRKNSNTRVEGGGGAAAAAGSGGHAGSAGETEAGEVHESWTTGPGGERQGEASPSASLTASPVATASPAVTAPATAAPSPPRTGAASRDGSGMTTAEGARTPRAAAPPTTTEALVASLLAPLHPRPFQYLEVLDLSFNQLQPHMVLLPGSPLALLPRLAELDLSSNQLRHLPSPAEIATAAAKVAAAAALGGGGGGGGGAAAAAVAGVAFPALRRLRLAHNGLRGGAIASLAALGPPSLTHLDLSHNAIAEAPRLKFLVTPLLSAEESAESFASSNVGNGFTITNTNGPTTSTSQPPGRVPSTIQHDTLAAQSSQQNRLRQQQQRQPAVSQWDREAQQQRFGAVLTRLAVLDMSYNRVASEGAVEALLSLPALQRLLLAGNPLVITAQRPRTGGAAVAASSKLDFGDPSGAPARPSVAASLTARFANIPEAGPRQAANTLAAAAAAVITAAAAPERVSEVYDRLDATIEQWRLNTVMEEDEEEEEEGEEEGGGGGEDRTFLTGIGIAERRRKGSATTTAASDGPLDTVAESGLEGQDDGGGADVAAPAGAADTAEERPLWESITDPTERLAVALGLDPLTLPMYTGALTTDSAGAIAALRFALAHPLVEANDGLAPHPGYAAATTAAQLKRKPRRPAPTQRLAPMGGGAAAAAAAAASAGAAAAAVEGGPKAAKIQTVEAMLEGMKGKLAALEASLAAQLAVAPSAEAARRAEAASRARYAAAGRRGNETDSEDAGDDDGGSTGSGLPEDVIDQIERESEDEDADDEQAVEDEMGPMDPKQGIVLMADQLIVEESTVDVNGNGNGLTSSGPSRVTVVVSTSPPQQASLRTAGSSPRRLGTAVSVGGASAGTASPRKGVSIVGPTGSSPQVPATPVVLPGGAASALGYAS